MDARSQTQTEIVLAGFLAAYPNAPVFMAGEAWARAIFVTPPERAHLVYIGEAVPEHLSTVLQAARAAGIDRVGDSILVDFSRFTGVLDWHYLAKEGDALPGMSAQPKNIAFLWSDQLGTLLVKGFADFVRSSRCRGFTDRGEAYRWLGWL